MSAYPICSTGLWIDGATGQVVDKPTSGVQLVPPGSEMTPARVAAVEAAQAAAPAVEAAEAPAAKPKPAPAAKPKPAPAAKAKAKGTATSASG